MLICAILTVLIGYFLGNTTAARFGNFLVKGLLSLAVMPVLYPIFSAISKIGGETWRE